MTYYDAMLAPVPEGSREDYIAFACKMNAAFLDNGATRTVDAWGTDLPRGKQTDFHRAVAAQDGETVVFGWVEWPDKATRDAGWGAMMNPDSADERMDPARNPFPFDGARMIFGGFETLFAAGDFADLPYVQGFLVPVPRDKREDYADVARMGWDEMFAPRGCLAHLEAWEDDIKDGTRTDMRRAVGTPPGGADEAVVWSFLAWPSKAVCDAAAEAMMAMEGEMPEMPFDGARMIYGGFERVLDLP